MNTNDWFFEIFNGDIEEDKKHPRRIILVPEPDPLTAPVTEPEVVPATPEPVPA